MFDPETQKIEHLRCEVEALKAQLARLLAERGEDPEAVRDHG